MVLNSDARIHRAPANYNGSPFFVENSRTTVGTDYTYRKLPSGIDV